MSISLQIVGPRRRAASKSCRAAREEDYEEDEEREGSSNYGENIDHPASPTDELRIRTERLQHGWRAERGAAFVLLVHSRQEMEVELGISHAC